MDPAEHRLQSLEQNVYELHTRSARTEESNIALNARCQALNDSLVKCHQVKEPCCVEDLLAELCSGVLISPVSSPL